MVGSISFVQATVADVPEIETLIRAAYSGYIERIDREPAPMNADYLEPVQAGRVLLAWRGSELLGVMVTEAHPDHLLVENLAVAPEAQGMGIGGRLLDAAEAEAVTLGLGEVRLYTNAKMTENLSYYPRRGYREVDRRTEDGFDRVYFSYVLRPTS